MPFRKKINENVSPSKKKNDVSGILFYKAFTDANKGKIKFKHIDNQIINTDLSTWGKQFEMAMKDGQESEGDLFNGMINKFDEAEW